MLTVTSSKPHAHTLAMSLTIETCMQTQKQIRILENRLEKMYHKYNESKSRNQVGGWLLKGPYHNICFRVIYNYNIYPSTVMHVYVGMYVRTSVCLSVCLYVCMYLCMYLCVCS